MAKQWLYVVIGLWVMLTPWLLGFSEFTLARWSNVICGLAVALMGIWALVEKSTKV